MKSLIEGEGWLVAHRWRLNTCTYLSMPMQESDLVTSEKTSH